MYFFFFFLIRAALQFFLFFFICSSLYFFFFFAIIALALDYRCRLKKTFTHGIAKKRLFLQAIFFWCGCFCCRAAADAAVDAWFHKFVFIFFLQYGVIQYFPVQLIMRTHQSPRVLAHLMTTDLTNLSMILVLYLAHDIFHL